jgi:hypothetical protein
MTQTKMLNGIPSGKQLHAVRNVVSNRLAHLVSSSVIVAKEQRGGATNFKLLFSI